MRSSRSVELGVQNELAHWVIGTDGRHSIVRRDLHATFRPIGEPRVSSVIRLAGTRSFEQGKAIQVSVTKNATHTVWPIEPGQLLWVTQTTGPSIPTASKSISMLRLPSTPSNTARSRMSSSSARLGGSESRSKRC